MPEVKDIYDREVERLTAHPESIAESWERRGPLFGYVTPNDESRRPDGKPCGCLTMIHYSPTIFAWTDHLTSAIRRDHRLMDALSGSFIKAGHLPVFAEWQRRIDKELNRKPPEM